MTMRLIFRPSARVSERWPSRVGFDSIGGARIALFEVAPDFDEDFSLSAFALKTAVVVGAGTSAVGVAVFAAVAGCVPSFADIAAGLFLTSITRRYGLASKQVE